jgi:putative heme-binding domain-containing protein
MGGALANEKDLFALGCAASAAQRVDPVWRNIITTRLILKAETARDPQLELIVWYAVQPWFERVPNGVTRFLPMMTSPVIRRLALRFFMEQLLDAQPRLLGDLFAGVMQSDKSAYQLEVLRGVREGLAGRKNSPVAPPEWTSTFAKLSQSEDASVRREAYAVALLFGDAEAMRTLARTATDVRERTEDRRAAVELLLTRKQPEFAKTLRGLLDDPAVRQVAIRGLAAFADAETPSAILKQYPQFAAEEKLDAVNTLAARTPWANALLDAIAKGTIPRSDVPVATARQILALNDKSLSARLGTVWGKIGSASKERAALTKKWKATLNESTLAKADVSRGRAMFAKHCASCHKMFGEGQTVGPELTGSQRANLDYVLENVLDPSAVVPNEFRLINFTTKDERVVSGIIVRETKDAVTVRTSNETVVLPTADIAARKQTNLSIMPDGLLDQMKPDEVRDLVAYLQSKEQVPIPK